MAPFPAQVQYKKTQSISHGPARISSIAHTPDLSASSHLTAVQTSPGAASSSSLGISSFQSSHISTPLNVSSSRLSPLSDHNNVNLHAAPVPTSAGPGPKSSVNGEPRTLPSLGYHNSADLSLPSSSQPSSNGNSTSMPPPPLPSHVHQSAATSPSAALPAGSEHEILGTLRETSALYNLSRADLENLVSRVVREDGFAELVCSSAIHDKMHLKDYFPSLKIWIRCGE